MCCLPVPPLAFACPVPRSPLTYSRLLSAAARLCISPHTHSNTLLAQEAATQLLQSDYALLSLEPRLALLRVLTDFAFVSDLARSHLDARTEAYAQVRVCACVCVLVCMRSCVRAHRQELCTTQPSIPCAQLRAASPHDKVLVNATTCPESCALLLHAPPRRVRLLLSTQAQALGKPVAASNAFSVPPAPAGGSAEAAAEHATAVRMLEEWVDWVELQRWVLTRWLLVLW